MIVFYYYLAKISLMFDQKFLVKLHNLKEEQLLAINNKTTNIHDLLKDESNVNDFPLKLFNSAIFLATMGYLDDKTRQEVLLMSNDYLSSLLKKGYFWQLNLALPVHKVDSIANRIEELEQAFSLIINYCLFDGHEFSFVMSLLNESVESLLDNAFAIETMSNLDLVKSMQTVVSFIMLSINTEENRESVRQHINRPVEWHVPLNWLILNNDDSKNGRLFDLIRGLSLFTLVIMTQKIKMKELN